MFSSDLTINNPTIILNEFVTKDTSNNVLVKPIKKNTKKIKPVSSLKLELTYTNYIENKIKLVSYTIPELKLVAKKYKLFLSGSKPLIIERIEQCFKKMKFAISIQCLFRGHIVRYFRKIKGDAFNNKSICVNDTDFVTMEPLNEITYEYFFSYKDNKNFTYGFNITSLIQVLKNKGKISNPYNREKLDNSIVNNIISSYKIAFIVYPEFKDENDSYNNVMRPIVSRPINTRQIIPNVLQEIYTNINNNTNIYNSRNNTVTNITNYRPTINIYTMDSDSRNRIQRINNIRANPVNQRITELFMDIDLLGNYTQSIWFSSLVKRDFIRLYQCLYDIWYIRSQMSREVRNKICPFYGPFDSIFVRPINYNDLSEEHIKLACLIAMESMVYSGIDEDSRKLGAFHALSGLTIVSPGARMALPWLYESVAF